jgi:O-glycosyl hydrolase
MHCIPLYLSIAALLSSATGADFATQLTVNLNQKYQTIDGFGFSEAFQRAYNIINLPEAKRAALIDLLFNTTTGVGFSILRNGLGSTPNSSADFMNTIIPVSPGSPSAKPTYVWDGKDSGQLWVAQQAVSRKRHTPAPALTRPDLTVLHRSNMVSRPSTQMHGLLLGL